MNEIILKAYEYFKDIHKARLWYRIYNPVLGMAPKQFNKDKLLRILNA